ncbi:MAG: hypothetical protein AAF907_12070 [Planctomycetota bacterium]
MVRSLSFLVVAVSCAVAADAVRAETLLLQIQARITSKEVEIPEQFADLNAVFDKLPGNGDVQALLLLPHFEQYADGEHTIKLNVGNPLNYGVGSDAEPKINTPGLSMILESKLLGHLEGVRTGVPGAGKVIVPDETQLADYGTLTVKDGKVTKFSYGWVKADNPGMMSINKYITGRRGFPVKVESLTIECDAFSTPQKTGEVSMVVAFEPDVAIKMKPAGE